MKAQTGKYREAVVDYDEFYDAIGGRVTAAFYLQREQAEIQCKCINKPSTTSTKP